jgi:hypothetical protein
MTKRDEGGDGRHVGMALGAQGERLSVVVLTHVDIMFICYLEVHSDARQCLQSDGQQHHEGLRGRRDGGGDGRHVGVVLGAQVSACLLWFRRLSTSCLLLIRSS